MMLSINGLDYEEINEYNEIRSNLYLGGIPQDISPFKYVFALNGRPTYHIPYGRMVIVRPFNDADEIPDENMLYDLAMMVLKYSGKGPTLVHCAAGINRSSMVLALALIIDGMTPESAIALIREKRSKMCLSNQTFENWLLEQFKV